MTGGGWEWQADRERWVAHAPVERGVVVLGLVALVGQTFFLLTAPDDAPIHGRPWLLAPTVVFTIVCAIHLLTRLRRQDVAYDGEVVEVVHGTALVRFRPADIVAVHPGAPANRDLLVLRVRPIERTIAGLRVPTLRRGTRVRAEVPSWWWHQVVGVPSAVTPWWTQRAWARLRRRPALPV